MLTSCELSSSPSKERNALDGRLERLQPRIGFFLLESPSETTCLRICSVTEDNNGVSFVHESRINHSSDCHFARDPDKTSEDVASVT
jgi:hypothetical protein